MKQKLITQIVNNVPVEVREKEDLSNGNFFQTKEVEMVITLAVIPNRNKYREE